MERLLSPRSMLVIDVAHIPPEGLDVSGAIEAADLQLEAEAELRLAPDGRLDCHLDRSEEGGVHVRGRLALEISVPCSRCLEDFALPVPGDLDLYFLPETPGAPNEAEEDVALSDRDMVVAYYGSEGLHLGDVVREQVLLSVPMKPLCAEGCRGRCPACGVNRNATPCACPPADGADLRLSGLEKLLNPDSL